MNIDNHKINLKCPTCASYYDITFEKQKQAAIILESFYESVEYIAGGLWKVERPGSKEEKQGIKVIPKTFTAVEILTPKELIERANKYIEIYGEKEKSKRGRKGKAKSEVEVQAHKGRLTRRVVQPKTVDSDSDKRRHKPARRSRDGSGNSKTVRGGKSRVQKRVRKAVKQVRKRGSRVR